MSFRAKSWFFSSFQVVCDRCMCHRRITAARGLCASKTQASNPGIQLHRAGNRLTGSKGSYPQQRHKRQQCRLRKRPLASATSAQSQTLVRGSSPQLLLHARASYYALVFVHAATLSKTLPCRGCVQDPAEL